MIFTGKLLSLPLKTAACLLLLGAAENHYRKVSRGPQTGSFASCEGEARVTGALIARYHAQDRMWRPDILVERMLLRKTRSFFGFRPAHYSNCYYVNPRSAPANTELITSGKDTLMHIGIHGVYCLPEKMVVHLYGCSDSVIYTLTEKINSNIVRIATVSWWEQWKAGSSND